MSYFYNKNDPTSDRFRLNLFAVMMCEVVVLPMAGFSWSYDLAVYLIITRFG